MSVEVRLIGGDEIGQDLLADWHGLRERNAALASPYFCPEFTQAVASVRQDIEVAVVERDRRVVGLFPFQRAAGAVGKPAGGIVSDYQGIIAAPDFECDPRALVKACQLSVWDFDHMPVSQTYFAPFHHSQEISPRIDVSRGYSAFVAERDSAGSAQIRDCAKLERRMERDIGKLRFVCHDADPGSLRLVLGWKSQQYLASGVADLFAREWIRRLMVRIHSTQTDEFAGMLSLLYSGDRLVAGHFGMRSRSAWHYWFPSYDKAMAKYSPGLILLLRMAEHAPSIGLQVIDLGKGMSLYKQRLMNSSVTLASGSVELPSWRAFQRRLRREALAFARMSGLTPSIRRLTHWGMAR